MHVRAFFRRVTPYVVVAISGFALAALVVVLVILPAATPHTTASDAADSVRAPLPVVANPAPVEESDDDSPAASLDTGVAVDSSLTWSPSSRTPPIVIPDVTQMALADARAKLEGMGFYVRVTHDTSSFDPPNTILRQSPNGLTQVPARSTVTLTASEFPPERSPSSN